MKGTQATPSPQAELGQISRGSGKALYSQLEEIVRDGIENGIWKPGEAIPSERELSRIYQMSRMTVRKSLERLVSAGLLYRVDGKGTYVSEPKVSFEALSLEGLREQAVRHGHLPSAKLLGVDRVFASGSVASTLGVDPDTPVYQIERVRFANDVPVAFHRSYIPCALVPGLPDYDLGGQSLYAILRSEYGIQISHARETLESTLASDRESLLLGIQPGSPMLLLRITVHNDKEQPIEYVKVVFRGDKVQLQVAV